MITHDVRGMGQVLTLRAGQVCTMQGYWNPPLKSHAVSRVKLSNNNT